jgi:hypothetical protein
MDVRDKPASQKNGPDRQMSRLTLGNGAATEYAYDALNRKTSLVVDIPSAPGLTSLNIEYDVASRLAREKVIGSGAGMGEIFRPDDPPFGIDPPHVAPLRPA